MPYAQLRSAKLYYEDHGSGEPIVFIHGFTLDHRQWAPQVEYFKSKYRCITLDECGHGLSEATPSGYDRANRVEDLKQFVDYLKLDTFHLCGLSRGGITSMGFAFAHQNRLKSLALVSTGAAGYNVGNKFSKLDDVARSGGVEEAKKVWLEMTIPWLMARHPEIAGIMKTMINEHSGAIWADPMRGKYVTPPDLDHVHEIKVPLFVIIGALDKIFVPLSRQIHEKVPGSRLEILPELGHMINLENPALFNKLYTEWLAEISSP
jgi:pimeloyl-ACP methyl ester carboxylesterase